VRIALLLPALVATTLAAVPAAAQDFDPVVSATGWARADADGSFTFFDPVGKRLVTWLRDGTMQGSVDLSKLDGAPEFWVIDSYGNAWVVVGPNLTKVDPKGKVGTRVRLAALVADLAWDPRGLVVAYKAADPYIEKRDYKGGSVLWSWGSKPSGSATSTVNLRIAVTNNNEVLVTRGSSLGLEVLDLQSGKTLRQVGAAYKGGLAPELDLGAADRGPLVAWSGKAVAFAAVTGGQAAHTKMNGLLLARLDTSGQGIEYLPTGLTEDHHLVGIVENEAAFLKPKGGLVFVPIR
jgi:hypothetical protein